jgi:hypothetical protein
MTPDSMLQSIRHPAGSKEGEQARQQGCDRIAFRQTPRTDAATRSNARWLNRLAQSRKWQVLRLFAIAQCLRVARQILIAALVRYAAGNTPLPASGTGNDN